MNIASGRCGPTAWSVSGTGPDVVLVHGLGLNQHMWQWQVPALEDRYRVIRYDLLGHGASEAPADPCTMEMMVQQLAELMQHLQLKPCALLGFSLGGLIVQAFTLAHPERIAALGVLHAAHGRTDEQRAAIMLRVEQSRESGPAATITAALERWFSGEFASRNPEVPEQVRQWVTANDPQVYPNLYRLLAIADIGLEESIRAITCPTLVMTAEEDYGNSPAMSERIAARIQGAQLEILPALRHMALAEDPGTCNRLIGNFLEEHIKAR